MMNRTPLAERASLVVTPPRLEDHLANDASFPSAYLRALAAVAAADGAVSVTEFAALSDIVRLTEESALAGMMLIAALERPRPLKAALSELRKASATLDAAALASAFEVARPLLALQGTNSRGLAKDFAEALRHPLTVQELEAFAFEGEDGFWSSMTRRSMRLVKGAELAKLADECARLTGDTAIVEEVRACEDGKLPVEAVRTRMLEACAAIAHEVDRYEEQLALAELAEASADNFVTMARGLHQQVLQRLAMVEARIEHERATLAEDIDDAVHDAGNAVELELKERLQTDKWTAAEVWERISRTTLAREMERRVDRLVSRRETTLHLLKEDLRLFQEDMRLTRASVLQRRHHGQLAKLMPQLRLATRVVNALDGAASLTLGVGAASIAGAGAAAYLLGASVVMPVIAPAVPFVGGALLVAGAFKWITDSDKRRDGEIRHKREAFEKAFRAQLEQAQSSFNEQLDVVAREFVQSARQIVEPIVLEADAAERIAGLQVKMARRVIAQSRESVSRLTAQLPR